MLRPGPVIHSNRPQVLCEDGGKQEKEQPGDLEPENVAGTGKWVPHGAAEIAAATGDSLGIPLRDACPALDMASQHLTLAHPFSGANTHLLWCGWGWLRRQNLLCSQTGADAKRTPEGARAHGLQCSGSCLVGLRGKEVRPRRFVLLRRNIKRKVNGAGVASPRCEESPGKHGVKE